MNLEISDHLATRIFSLAARLRHPVAHIPVAYNAIYPLEPITPIGPRLTPFQEYGYKMPPGLVEEVIWESAPPLAPTQRWRNRRIRPQAALA